MTTRRKHVDQRYPNLYYLWLTVILSILFTLLEPEATQGTPFLPRLVQWFFQIGLAIIILINVHVFLQHFRWFNRQNNWLKLGLSGLLGGIVFTPIDVVIDVMAGLDIWPVDEGVGRQILFVVEDMSSIVPPVVLVWIAINAPRILQLNFARAIESDTGIEQRVADQVGTTSEIIPEMPSKDVENVEELQIFSQIPAHLGREIIYLKSELHYLQVVTNKGECLILFNLRDAMEQLNSVIPGIQTHRSYWVAGNQVAELIRQNGRTFIKTKGQHQIPVSRRNVTEVKQKITLFDTRK